MTHMVDEREPGVYVRSNRPEQELDFLWDKDRRKAGEHERFHLGFFAAGAVSGSLLTLGICFFFFAGNDLMAPPPDVEPVVVEQAAVQAKPVAQTPQAEAPKTQEKKGFSLPFMAPKAEQKPVTNTAPEEKARMYAVQSGDTLGSIAIKFYETSSPEMVEKIQRANKMDNADSLQLGQKLVIPPKNY